MVEAKSFPYCCTARILCNFGESMTSEGGNFEVTEEKMTKEIEELIKNNKNNAMLVATTNNQQKVAYRVLKKLGFKSTKWMTKTTHKETKVKMWWLPLGEE